MGGQAVVGVAEVPQVVGNDEHPRHVGPQHILALLGDVDAEPSGHAEDIEQAGHAVEDVEDAAVEDDALARHEARTPCHDGALEIARDRDQDVDGDDHERERLEPVRTADLAPAVLEHHEADAPGRGGVHLGVVEPSIHVGHGGIVEAPLETHACSDGHNDAIDGHETADAEEEEYSSGLPAACHLIEQDERYEHHEKS